MKLSSYFSFLKNKTYKIKVAFLIIIFFAIFIVLADAISIFTLIPLVSIISDSNSFFSGNNLYQNYFPDWFQLYLRNYESSDLILFLLGIFLFRNLVTIFNNYIIFRFMKFLEVDTSKKVFFLWFNKDYLNFYNQTSGELLKDFKESIGGYVMFVESVTRFISDLLIFILFSLILLYISFNETLIIFIYYILIFFTFRKIVTNFSIKHGIITNLSSEKINLSIINSYKNYSQIILRKLKEKFLNIYMGHAKNFAYSRLIVSFFQVNTKQFFEIFIIIFVVILLNVIDLVNVYKFNDILSLLIVFLVAAYRMLPLINNIVASLVKLKNYQYPYNIIENHIKNFNKKYKNTDFSKEVKNKFDFLEKIELKNISFKYKSDQQYLFKRLNLKIRKNQIIGVIGGSGQGKTTIVKILLGLIRPISGQILLDKKKISNKQINKYQNLFGYLPQENLFIPGSIKENIAFGDNNINEEKVIKSLKEANCLEFVNKLKDKINYQIIENGKNFSIGQLQRFALARILYFNNEVIVLDEPTSALDNEAEKKFINLIYKLKRKKTIIIISHKESTLKNCEKIYRIKNNRFIEKKSDL